MPSVGSIYLIETNRFGVMWGFIISLWIAWLCWQWIIQVSALSALDGSVYMPGAKKEVF
jgi:hypothetical protein